MQTQLVTLLSGATDAGARVSPLTVADGTPRPYITYQRISAQPENVLSGSTGLINTRVQMDIYADTYAQAQSVAAAVAALMAGWTLQNVSNAASDIYEAEVKLHRVLLDYSVWHS